ncbi:hypothetical protein ACVME8_001988 [Bradyrhizobium diazoefficiens]
MNRYVTIATVFLLPPLLFAAENYGRLKTQPVWGLALVAAGFSLAGAMVALDPEMRSRSHLWSLSSLTLAIAILVAITFAVEAIPRGSNKTYLVALAGCLCSTPLMGALFLWRPKTRIFSLPCAALAALCALPFVLLGTTSDFFEHAYDRSTEIYFHF